MTPTVAVNDLAAEVEEQEIGEAADRAQTQALDLHPEPAAVRIAPAQVPEREVAVPLHLEDVMASRQFGQAGIELDAPGHLRR